MSSPQAKPEPAKQLLPFLQRADELQKHDLLVAYYCRLYAMELGLKIPVKERTKATNALLVSLINQLEKDKKVVKSSPEDNLYMEGFALSVFSKADKQDRAGRADLNTAKTFYAASIFFDVLHQFGDLQPDIEQKAKYSVWKAADIRKALSEGQRPTPGPPGGDQEFSVMGSEWENEVSDILDHQSQPADQGPLTPDGHGAAPVHPPVQGSLSPDGPDALHPPSFPGQGEVTPDRHGAPDLYQHSFSAQGAVTPDRHGAPDLHQHSFSAQGAFTPDRHGAPDLHRHSFSAQGAITPDRHGAPDLHQHSFSAQGLFTPDVHGAAALHSPYPVPDAGGSEPAYYFTPESSTYPPTPMQHASHMETTGTPLPPNYNGIYYDGGAQHQPSSAPPAHGLYGSPPERVSDGTYQPTPEKVAEAHKAAKYAVGALAFDDVPTALSFLRRSLELLTSPSATIH